MKRLPQNSIAPTRKRRCGRAKTLGEWEREEAPRRGLWFSSAGKLGQETILEGSQERVGRQIRFPRIWTVPCGVRFVRRCGFCQFLSFEGKGIMGKAKEGFFALGLVCRPIFALGPTLNSPYSSP